MWLKPKPKHAALPRHATDRSTHGTHLCAADRGTRLVDAPLVNSQRDPVCATQYVEVSATHAPTHSAHRRHGKRRVVRGVAMAPASRARGASNGGAGPGTDGDSPLPVVTPGSGAARCPEQCTARCKHLQTATYAWSETPGASGGGAAGTGLASHRVGEEHAGDEREMCFRTLPPAVKRLFRLI